MPLEETHLESHEAFLVPAGEGLGVVCCRVPPDLLQGWQAPRGIFHTRLTGAHSWTDGGVKRIPPPLGLSWRGAEGVQVAGSPSAAKMSSQGTLLTKAV